MLLKVKKKTKQQKNNFLITKLIPNSEFFKSEFGIFLLKKNTIFETIR